MDDHIVFFFGAGVSRPSGMPSVDDITQKVLDAPLVYTENKRYVFPESVESNPNIGPPRDTSEEHVGKVQGFINTIWKHAHTVLSQFDRPVTYEDLYSMCGQVVSDQEPKKLDTNPVEPAVRPFSKILQEEGILLHDDDNPQRDLFDTANEAQFLISGVVRELLSDSPDHIRGLDPLLDAIDDPEVDRVTIVTLNHDLLLEQLLEQSLDEGENGVVDGFERVKDGVRRYKPKLLFDVTAEVTLIKPHGSINWYYDRGEDGHFSFSSIPPNPDQESFDLHYEPSILSGYQKEENYTGGIFGDMVDAFLQALHDTNTVIESGFGWTDNGMYNHLHRYLNWNEQNQLLLLHPEDDFQPDENSPESFHPLDFTNSFRHPPEGLIRSLPKYLKCTCWAEMKTHIEQS